MILDFSIGNYRSVNKVQTLNFRATTLVSEDKIVDQNNIIDTDGLQVLKTVGLYGPNGSGKSNLVRAFNLFRQLIERSLESEVVMDNAADPFILSSEQSDNAGFFQIQLMVDHKKYRYGFTLHPQGSVLQEWLFGPAEKKETWYFKRTGDTIETNREWFDEAHSLPFENLRRNTLFLTFVSAYNGMVAQTIRNFIVKRFSFENIGSRRASVVVTSNGTKRAEPSPKGLTNQLIKEGKGTIVLDWLKSAGLQYTEIDVRNVGNVPEKVLLTKSRYDREGNFAGSVILDLDRNESAGTRKFYSFIGLLYDLFNNGGLLVSDEIDNNFHPFLLQQFIRFFNDPTINKAGAQLLFTSHDTNLLQPEILRRDQIFFTEKSLSDETILYSLADLKGIRNNADFARQYLAGFYGALPILENYKHD
ncbi:MAG TPA: ATP-binding protein [Puia sp.]|nr:ATP-binding protein [Puia sp.]